MIGVDVARYQGTIDFDKLKKEVDFIIIQAGFGRYASQKDICFDRNYSEAKRTKIPTGAYWFSYAASPEEAKQEAKACLEVLKGKKFEMPIYYDIEGAALSGDVVGKCDAFCSVLEANGYYAGVYISRSPAEHYIKNSRIANKYTYWIAEYPTLHYSGRYDMWQNSSTGNVAGIMDDVDTDYCYKDFPTIIKEGGLNGYEKPKTPTPKPQSPELDTEGWKYKDHDRGIYLMKQILRKCYFRNLDDNDIMGQGTVNAVNSILKENGYRANGIAGKGFINLITNTPKEVTIMWERIDTGIYKQIYKGSEIMIICNWRTWHVWIDGEMIDITFSTLGRAKEFVHAVQLISESVQFKH